jgi:hypothetical protein
MYCPLIRVCSPNRPDKEKSNVIASESHTIKQQVFSRLDKDPLEKPKDTCFLLQLDYKKHGGTVANAKTEWKSHFKNGLGSKSPKQHYVRTFCYVPKCLDRKQFGSQVVPLALAAGWIQSRNRNRGLIWKDPQFGRIEWWETGRILETVKKPRTMLVAKKLLSRAFFDTYLINDLRICSAFLNSVRWFGSHDVYEYAERLPYRVIDNYVKSHGIRIVTGDVTDPNGLEVQWCHPDVAERGEILQQQMSKALELNSQQIQVFSQFMQDLSQPKPKPKDDRMCV